MRLFLLTALTMVAFAANSVLNRLALAGDEAGPAAFAALRLASGALALVALVAWRKGWRPRLGSGSRGAAALALYMLGFSFAYVTLDAGVGALILFGGVQITMFAGALLEGQRITGRRWAGAAIAFAGLAVLVWPRGGAAPEPVGVALMAAAALGWGIYSLIGRGASDPLAATATSFVLATPVAAAALLILPDGLTWRGAGLAVISGTVTSAAGYALWYNILPILQATRAAVAQLSVPVIAAIAGVLFLGEPATARLAAATLLVVGGIALSLTPSRRQRTSVSSGS